MPDLDELAGFDPGTPTPMLPPSEVRRRGDRRRRTTTLAVAGAALAAAVAVGAPVALLSGDGGGRDVQPAPPVPSADPEWVTTVPADFPLTAGFPDEDAVPNDALAQDASLAVACRSAGFAGYADNAVVTYQGESEDRAVRILVVYPDAASAAAELDELRGDIDGCAPREVSESTTMVFDTVPVELGTEESFAFSQQIRHDDGLVSDLTLFEVARTGNAIFVDMTYGAAGGDQVVGPQAQRMVENATAPLQEMCRFAERPCSPVE